MKTGFENISVLREADIANDIDIEFCVFLQHLDPQISTSVLAAALLTSKAYRNGDVCVKLDDYAGQDLFKESKTEDHLKAPELSEWIRVLHESSVVGRAGAFKPLILDDSHRLYLQKFWQYEQNLAAQILKCATQEVPEIDDELLGDGLNRLFTKPEKEPDWQKIAVTAAIFNKLTVISGGPGTGKTTIITRLLALILEQAHKRNQTPAIALAAPTGKAAARMESSILALRDLLNVRSAIKTAIPVDAVTIHQLLGAQRYSSRFRFNSDNPLPYDWVIVDEASMIDQALMSKLMDALLDKTQLVLLGDKDQLASVEAGSVMGDMCGVMSKNQVSATMQDQLHTLDVNLPYKYVDSAPSSLTDHIIFLNKNYRFDDDSGIGRLAKAINQGEAERAWSLLNDAKFPDIKIKAFKKYKEVENALFDRISKQYHSARSTRVPLEILNIYSRFKILAAHRNGPWGVQTINKRMEKRLHQQALISPYKNWYEGQPVIINTNDYSLGLSNGDLGVCLMEPENKQLKVYFKIKERIIAFSPSRLPEYSTAFALTVHKSQGSEFDDIIIVLPDKLSPILSRELLYTAVTRARNSVLLLTGKEVLFQSIKNKIARNSGLTDHLWQ